MCLRVDMDRLQELVRLHRMASAHVRRHGCPRWGGPKGESD
jgi:hypothetical protein